MVAIFRKYCSHGSCSRFPCYNFEGSKKAHAVYCKKHAQDGMVDVVHKRCKHDSCTTIPSYNVKGSKTAVYCKQHANTGMVNVYRKRCSHDPCTGPPAWGVLVDDEKAACIRSDLLIDRPVISFRAPCETAGCNELAKWGLDGKRPTHCPVHGRLKEGLVCILGYGGSKAGFRDSYSPVLEGLYPHVKAECSL